MKRIVLLLSALFFFALVPFAFGQCPQCKGYEVTEVSGAEFRQGDEGDAGEMHIAYKGDGKVDVVLPEGASDTIVLEPNQMLKDTGLQYITEAESGIIGGVLRELSQCIYQFTVRIDQAQEECAKRQPTTCPDLSACDCPPSTICHDCCPEGIDVATEADPKEACIAQEGFFIGTECLKYDSACFPGACSAFSALAEENCISVAACASVAGTTVPEIHPLLIIILLLGILLVLNRRK